MKEYTLQEKVMRMAGAMEALVEAVNNEKAAKANTIKRRHELQQIEEDIQATRQDLMATV